MTKRIITQEAARSRRLNEHLQGLKNLYKEDLEKMVYFCYSEFDATYDQIGQALGISRAEAYRQYPKKENHGTE